MEELLKEIIENNSLGAYYLKEYKRTNNTTYLELSKHYGSELIQLLLEYSKMEEENE